MGLAYYDLQLCLTVQFLSLISKTNGLNLPDIVAELSFRFQ